MRPYYQKTDNPFTFLNGSLEEISIQGDLLKYATELCDPSNTNVAASSYGIEEEIRLNGAQTAKLLFLSAIRSIVALIKKVGQWFKNVYMRVKHFFDKGDASLIAWRKKVEAEMDNEPVDVDGVNLPADDAEDATVMHDNKGGLLFIDMDPNNIKNDLPNLNWKSITQDFEQLKMVMDAGVARNVPPNVLIEFKFDNNLLKPNLSKLFNMSNKRIPASLMSVSNLMPGRKFIAIYYEPANTGGILYKTRLFDAPMISKL